ncbi:MAG: succinylglutamate-semialdehyde dehydrogenase [Parachlamydiaceae bacterium]
MANLNDRLQSFDSATRNLLFECEVTSREELNQIIGKARKAYSSWIETSLESRIQLLHQFAKLLQKRQDAFAHWISQESGKLLTDSRGEITAMIAKVEISIAAYHERCKMSTYELGPTQSITRFKPHGILGVFGPFNFPGHLPNGHIIPALLAGNVIIFKPSELTPFTGQKLVELYHEAGFPKDVVQIVQGGPPVGQLLAHHDEIDGILFTGSAKVGLSIQETLLKNPGKILALEMGGNNPLVVGQTNHQDIAIRHILQSAFQSSGQRCTCARRLILIENQHSHQILKQLQKRIEEITVGPYITSPEPFMGPVINQASANKLLAAQNSLREQGARILVEMKQLHPQIPLLSPALIDVTHMNERHDEELFGPFLQCIQVRSLEEAIQEANHTRYGLIAGLISDHLEEYEYFWKHVKAGLINWNTPLTGASSKAPFGGIKMSGNFRPGAFFAADYCAYPVASMESTPFVKKESKSI